ncbi:sigma-54-dependent transcriptional regulator [Planctellipticum variicoloris]|uniref:sigma-54-dependent transcriptional regulator n=1 Tax=Planctellipticum variicoloris TaxID=3064265 RepID=UPI0030133845|nr:sigma-54 dependent transcriptional regulator [Planctomycetaceae bacterium SH412]
MRALRSVLIVEDEEIIRTSLREFLSEEGYDVAVAGTVAAALQVARQRDFHVAICDVQLPDGDGVQLLRRLQQLNPGTSVMIITAYATVENAVEAFKSGAFDYLVKPVIFDDLANKLNRLFQYRELYLENQALRRELGRRDNGDEIIGSSKAIQEVQDAIRKVAVTRANVLLVGESGTGKELFARMIHKWGPRSGERFFAANCATRPTEMLESQLFGAQAGMVAGSPAAQDGLLRLVGEGTVFLDEVSQLPLATQAKLLRAIEYQEALPLGGSEPYKVSARIIAATTRDLQREVADARFDEALFYRLDGVKIRIPPLRERLDDVPELVEFLISKHSRAMGQRVTGATSETIRLLMSAQWKGNIRQLDNALERAVMMCDSPQIRPQDLPADLIGMGQPLPDTDDLRSALRHYERLHIKRVLRQCPDKREAAKRLKLGLSSLYRKIEELGIDLE